MGWHADVAEYAGGHSARGFSRMNCPACPTLALKVDHDKSVSINHQNGWYRCHRCSFRGRLPGFSDLDPWDQDDEWEDVEEQPEVEPPSSYEPLIKNQQWNPRAMPGVRYAQSRGIVPRVMVEAQLGYAPTGQHRNRLIIPVLGGVKWVGWTGRLIRPPRSDYEPKYRTSEKLPQDALLGPSGVEQPDDFIVATEGPLDALRVWPYGWAFMGKPNTKLERLMRIAQGRHIVVALDGDAWRESQETVTRLQLRGQRASALLLPPGQDVDSSPREEVLRACRMGYETNSTIDVR